MIVNGYAGTVTAVTHGGQVIWIRFPGSLCSEPYFRKELEGKK